MLPGILDWNAQASKIVDVARDQGQLMGLRGRGEERVHRPELAAGPMASRGDSPPSVRYTPVDVEDAAVEASRQVVGDPVLKPLTASSSWHQLHPTPQLRE